MKHGHSQRSRCAFDSTALLMVMGLSSKEEGGLEDVEVWVGSVERSPSCRKNSPVEG